MTDFTNFDDMAIEIRLEKPSDIDAIRLINEEAFETSSEAILVMALRDAESAIISLIAESDGKILGHCLFSPATITGHAAIRVANLGPVAVLPAYQGRRIGSALITTGLDVCTNAGYGAVTVLGHPSYYPRFGFVPASRYNLGTTFDVPDDVFMAKELTPAYLANVSGQVTFHQAFDNV